MKAPQTKLCEFWIEGRFSPLKVSLISGCFYWHHVAWSHVQFGAAFSLLNSIFDLRLLYGNTEMTNIPPLSCQDMNEILLQRVFWLWLIKSCSVGTCGLFLLAFVFWSSLSFPHTHTHTPQLEDRQHLSWLTSHTPPFIPRISLHHSHPPLRLLFLPFPHISSYPTLTPFPPENLVPAWTQLEHISTCISSDYQPYIHTLTLSCDAAPLTEWSSDTHVINLMMWQAEFSQFARQHEADC